MAKITHKNLKDGLAVSIAFTEAEAAAINHCVADIEGGLGAIVGQLVEKSRSALLQDAMRKAEECHCNGESVPAPYGEDKVDKMISWYLNDECYEGDAKQRVVVAQEKAKLEEEAKKKAVAELDAEAASLEG